MKMSGKQYICGYKHCLHKNEKVSSEESVLIGNRHYHKDCAEIKRRIIECAELYMSYIEDKTQYPTVLRIINTLTFKNKVPIEYTYRSIANSKTYYSDKPVYVLYGIRKTFWTHEFPAQ